MDFVSAYLLWALIGAVVAQQIFALMLRRRITGAVIGFFSTLIVGVFLPAFLFRRNLAFDLPYNAFDVALGALVIALFQLSYRLYVPSFRQCVYCAATIRPDYAYCPNCGRTTRYDKRKKKPWARLAEVNFVPLLFAFAFLLGCGVFSLIWLPRLSPVGAGQSVVAAFPPPTPIPMQHVVIIVQDILGGMPITPNVVALRPMPMYAVPFDPITSVDDALGKVAQTALLREQPLLKRNIAEQAPVARSTVEANLGMPLPEGVLRRGSAITSVIIYRSPPQHWILVGQAGEEITLLATVLSGTLHPAISVWDEETEAWIEGRRQMAGVRYPLHAYTVTLPRNGIYSVIINAHAAPSGDLAAALYELRVIQGEYTLPSALAVPTPTPPFGFSSGY